MTTLSTDKPEQELQALQLFVDLYNESNFASVISSVEQLPENGHDFSASHGGRTICIQLTELVDRSYAFQMTREEYDEGKWREAVQMEFGGIPWRVDSHKRDMALLELVNRKATKYAPQQQPALWLVIFTIDSSYLVECVQNGQTVASAALLNLRRNISLAAQQLFSEIWFCNLETKPILLWARSKEP